MGWGWEGGKGISNKAKLVTGRVSVAVSLGSRSGNWSLGQSNFA